ncbi:DNA-directed RNA polymerase subunit RPC12/RpoP [Methanomicrobium sp. W14]|uniref:hypothetical protein n=1 Tax=Methanomicrobium sp. W14 TaxID=2817839 RepID=UPI001AE63D3B|nr:hypothetical protein [Methanomicrobium sp. W14]MBP2133402.1 DNA-directed RNA polymerase subunit RPC12/RpoP [Methanomicrobium sp. W14]
MGILQIIKEAILPKKEEPIKTVSPKPENVKQREETSKKSGPDKAVKVTVKRDYSKYIEELISDAGYRDYTPAGNPDAVCPSCKKSLESFPQKKMPCPYCNADIFVRTRTSDKKKILLNEEQLEEFDRQRTLDSGKYDTKMKNLAEKMEKYSETGGWVFLSALDEKDSPEVVKLHGRVIKSGSEEETEALKLLARPDSRARTKTWFNDPEKDTDLKEYEIQRKEWLDKYQ